MIKPFFPIFPKPTQRDRQYNNDREMKRERVIFIGKALEKDNNDRRNNRERSLMIEEAIEKEQ